MFSRKDFEKAAKEIAWMRTALGYNSADAAACAEFAYSMFYGTQTFDSERFSLRIRQWRNWLCNRRKFGNRAVTRAEYERTTVRQMLDGDRALRKKYYNAPPLVIAQEAR